MAKHLPEAHAYADDLQLYFSFELDSSNSQREAIKLIEECIVEVRIWMVSHRLLTNDTKTEFLIIGSQERLFEVSIESVAFEVWSVSVILVNGLTIICLWILMLSKLVVKLFVAYIPSGKQRKFRSEESAKTLVHAFINSLLYGMIPNFQCDRLQKILKSGCL